MPPLAFAPRRLDLDETLEALEAWHNDDVDELDHEPDDLQLLARLSCPGDATEAPGA
jgi:hypothetical protein